MKVLASILATLELPILATLWYAVSDAWINGGMLAGTVATIMVGAVTFIIALIVVSIWKS